MAPAACSCAANNAGSGAIAAARGELSKVSSIRGTGRDVGPDRGASIGRPEPETGAASPRSPGKRRWTPETCREQARPLIHRRLRHRAACLAQARRVWGGTRPVAPAGRRPAPVGNAPRRSARRRRAGHIRRRHGYARGTGSGRCLDCRPARDRGRPAPPVRNSSCRHAPAGTAPSSGRRRPGSAACGDRTAGRRRNPARRPRDDAGCR